MKFSNFVLMGFLITVIGCASASTTVLEAPKLKLNSDTINIIHAEDTVAIEENLGSYFRRKLAEELYKEGGFKEGAGLTLRYRFIQLDAGSRTKRYFLGPIAGKGKLTIEIIYLDDEGNELSKIHTGGEISGGVFGGSFKSALDKSAKESAEYAINNYL